MVALDPHVNPKEQLPLIVLYSTFNILACLGYFTLLVVGLRVARLRRNLVLLGVELVFFVATGAAACVTYTGHVMSDDTPFELCLVSGAFGSSLSAAQTAAAFSLTLKVWAHALMMNHPRSVLLQQISSSTMVCLFMNL
jgi:hypothetical protein